MKVLGVVGSQRKNGNTSALVKEALKPFEENGIDTKLVFLGDYNINDCNGCDGCQDTFRCIVDDDMQDIYPKILEADAIVLGSPTYFYNVSGDMKTFIDRCYCFEAFDEGDRSVWMGINEILGIKYAVVVAVCEQNNAADMGYTAEVMEKPLEALGYRVVSTAKILNLFSPGEAVSDQIAMEKASKAGEKLLKTLKFRDNLTRKLRSTGYNNLGQ
ncbi:NADPH-dependent FMN reductase [Methanosalsum zhilinae DSM 4017]|uniref:NADPH-dependent FMN reductase n=1 Tax=Methanosalsum zhilinae (strain DSM 4017 / NBRC 107636 / OCM 62 / WeN5) TaxID=679901 RepID=F7XQI1_METZD|nr:flavodoxin family protein [Methanosalsum zhilinae]AEH60482.1 NADPH-dependent FMN reductase [Methanosalsum zhilinae DSM 4017]